MPADFLLGLGGALGGAGQFAGGLSSLFGGGSNRNAPSGNTVYWNEIRRQDNFLQRRVADATAAGLHPLFALGAAAQASPAFAVGSSGGGSGAGYADMGFGAANILGGLSRIIRKKESALADSASTQAKKDKLELEQARRFYRNMKTPAMPGFVPGVSQVAETVVPARPLLDQVMSSDGALIVREPEEALVGAGAERFRDLERRKQANYRMKHRRRRETADARQLAYGRKNLMRRLIRKYGHEEGLRRYNRVVSKRRAYGP